MYGLLFAIGLSAAALVAQKEVSVTGAVHGGFASAAGSGVYFWGDSVWHYAPRDHKAKRLAKGPFAEGGCAVDVNGDGREDLVLQEGTGLGRLVWLEAPRWQRHPIDEAIEMHDCLAAEMLGHRGFVMVHRFSQIRFYEWRNGVWDITDLYSIYTASHQSGLLAGDVDGDGRSDLYCGNYWARSPVQFDLPWRLFAINVLHEHPESARFRLALAATGELVAAQGFEERGRVVVFRKPANPREQWPAQDITAKGGWRYPRGLATADLDADGRLEVVIAEHNGRESRLAVASFESGQWKVVRIIRAKPTVLLLRTPGGITLIHDRGMTVYNSVKTN